MVRPRDGVLDLGIHHRRAEVVLRANGRGNLLAQLDRFLRGVDRHLEFRFFVFLDAERRLAVGGPHPAVGLCLTLRFTLGSATRRNRGRSLSGTWSPKTRRRGKPARPFTTRGRGNKSAKSPDSNPIDAQRRIVRNLPIPFDPTVFVRRHLLLPQPRPLRVDQFQAERLAGELGCVRHVVLGVADPELVVHRLFRPINGPVGNRIGLGRVVVLVVAAVVPDAVEAHKGETIGIVRRRDEPLEVGRQSCGVDDRLSLGVGEFGRFFCRDIPPRAVSADALLLPTEEVQLGLRDRGAGFGVGDEVEGGIGERLADDDRVIEPQNEIRRIAVAHLRFDQIGARLFEWNVDGDPLVEMIGPRIELQVPPRRLFAEVFPLVLVD